MAYQVLARKWRPKTFADLVGQEHVVQALRNALDKGRLHHAYLLTGTRGVGKTTIARILAKSLNCSQPQHGEPCGVCGSCSQIDSGRFVDLLEIDAASNTGIDNIREVLENAQYAPTAGKYKVYIIDEVHMLSKSAFNAMLKTLEEPPEHVKFILATTDPHKVPVTVLSRCLQFVLRNMTPQQVASHLAYVLDQEGIVYQPAALQLLGRAAAGSMRDALSLLDQAIAMGSGQVGEADVRQMIGAVDKQYLYELLHGLVAQDGRALMAKAEEMAARAVGFDNALTELALLLQRLALIQAVPNALAADDPDAPALHVLAAQLGAEQIQLYYQCAVHGKQDLALAPDEHAGFLMTLLRMLAFAPMAAANHPASGQIEGSELHDPHVAAGAENGASAAATPLASPPVLPSVAAPVQQSVAAPNNTSPVVPTQPEAPAAAAEPVVTAPQPVPAATLAAADDVPPWQDLPETEASLAAETAEAEYAAPPAADQAPAEAEPRPSETQPPSVPYLRDQVAEYQDEAEDWPAAEEEAPTLPQAQAAAPDEADEDELQLADAFVPLPEFAAEHWHAILKRLAQKLGAAQMLAQFCAWVGYDAGQQQLMLALNGHSAANTSREYFDKIRQALAEAYQLPGLSLQTCPWQDDQGWETPTMRRSRLQQEGRLKAKNLLEADPACQTLMAATDCRVWKNDSLELAENMDA